MKTIMKIQETIGFKISTVLTLKRRLTDIDMKALGLSRTQWRVLLRLNISGSSTQKKMLEYLDIDCAHLTRVLDQLEQEGLVTRTLSQEDRRVRIVSLTQKCQQHIMPHIVHTLTHENDVLLKKVSASEKKQLGQLLDQLEQNLSAALELHKT
jgi:MarR family transcriptional regulator for hemolysin